MATHPGALGVSAFVGIRHLGETSPRARSSLGRLLVTALALLRADEAAGSPAARPRREWPLIVAGGASWFGVYNLALNEAERRIDAGTAAMLIQIGPLLVALLARVPRRAAHALAADRHGVGFGGVAHDRPRYLAGRQRRPGRRRCSSVVAAVMFAVGVLTQKKLLPRMAGRST